MAPDDFRDSQLLDPARAAEGLEGAVFEIDAAATAHSEPARPEPILAFVPPAEIAETARLDPERAIPERQLLPVSRQRGFGAGALGSLGLHLLPLLLLLQWTIAPAETATPIPVQLVIEAPPPPPSPPPPKPEPKPPAPGRLASEDVGETASPPPEAAAAAPPVPSEAAPSPPAPSAAAPSPPSPSEAAPTPPEPMRVAAAMPPPPKPIQRPKPAVPAFEWHRLDTLPQVAPREARFPGPAATRDEYLAYCMSLIRRHFGGLSPAFLAGRHGETVFHLVVLDDGRIAHILMVQHSPYADIDEKIEAAVETVARFPPLPQWLQGPNVRLTLVVNYPDGL